MGLVGYLIVSALAFAIGIAIIVMRRNGVAVLMGVEMILNAAALNFVAFSKYVVGNVNGQVIAVFVIIIAAAEAAVALAIVLNIYNNFSTINVDEADKLRE
ncbi:MAG: NADH-quinone oxidoreductase subunit NuoK [Planctomycetes bacterium]|nr:NADH-quinone oxidoreductase subunit NuoK [Planctomycetota bacterium]